MFHRHYYFEFRGLFFNEVDGYPFECEKERLSSVMTLEMSEQIIEAAQFNYKLRVRSAGVCDLIAAEAKYHLP